MQDSLKHRDLTEKIIGVFYEVSAELGHGFLECVYEEALAIAFQQSGIRYERQKLLAAWFRGHEVGEFKADLIVEDQVLLELKACRTIERAHEAQLLNYLRCTDIEVGLLLNFGPVAQFRRLAFDNARKKRVRALPSARMSVSPDPWKAADQFPLKSKTSASSAKSAAGF